MEKRTILAVLLMAGLLMVYQLLFVKSSPPERAAPPTAKKETAPAPAPLPVAPPVVTPVVSPKEAPPITERKGRVETPLYRAVVSSQGGRLDVWDLIYRGVKPMVVGGQMGPLGLTVSRNGCAAQPVAFALSPETLTLTRGARPGELKLIGEDGFGLQITATMRFHADSYVVEHEIKVENRHSVAQTAEIGLTWVAPVEWPKGQEPKFQG